MNNKKKLINLFPIAVYAFLLERTGIVENISDLYYGVEFSGHIFLQMLSAFSFFIYSMYSFLEFDFFTKNQGIYMLVRGLKRKSIYSRITLRAIQLVVYIAIAKITIFLLIYFLANTKLLTIDLVDFIRCAFLEFLIVSIFIVVQMNIEILISAKTGLLCINILYILSIYIGDIIFLNQYNANYLLIVLPNLYMKSRWEIYDFNYIFLVIYFVIVFIIIQQTGCILFRRKDIF